MLTNKIIKVLLLLLGGFYILLQGFGLDLESSILSTIMVITVIVLYNKTVEDTNKYFFYFLVAFAIGKIISLFAYYGPIIGANEMDYYYFFANFLYILSYIFLIVKILKDLDLKIIFTQFFIPIFILVVLDVFCVSIITATTEATLSFYEYTLEYIYNGVIMILLSAALINYMYRNDNKSMLFLIGSICIVFSEIIQLAYYYILEESALRFIYSFFLVIAFLFYYLQSQLKFEGPVPAYNEELLEA
ncbi:hypothetical protein [Winogradskyella sp.]|uniref:hypothetical protein n=1 Tax=Winogradskyella sp. TaxID=1883156 RepID=UPI003F6CB907